MTRARPALRCTTTPRRSGRPGRAGVPSSTRLRRAARRRAGRRGARCAGSPGRWRSSSAMSPQAATRRSRGTRTATPRTTSATPERKMSSRCAGSQGGIIGQVVVGADEVREARRRRRTRPSTQRRARATGVTQWPSARGGGRRRRGGPPRARTSPCSTGVGSRASRGGGPAGSDARRPRCDSPARCARSARSGWR